jgi:[ribosomal protein S5]-alanine N-acetyltransferase
MTIELRSPRLVLRSLMPNDRAEFIRVQEVSQHVFEPWMPQRLPGETFGDLFDQQLARAQRGAADGTEYRLVGVLPDGTIAGFFNLFQITRGVFQNGTAGWSVNAEAAGQGYGTEGVGALLDLAFADEPLGLGLHRVQANIMPTNATSLRVADKVGFRREGLGKAYLKIAGKWEDHILCAKLAENHIFQFFSRSMMIGCL